MYPFVRPEQLDEAVGRISAALQNEPGEGVKIALDSVGVFERAKRENTIYLTASDDKPLGELRGRVIRALGGEEGKGQRKYQMHLTMGQSEDAAAAPHKFLVEKVGRVPRVEWNAGEMAVLVRERGHGVEGGSVMRGERGE